MCVAGSDISMHLTIIVLRMYLGLFQKLIRILYSHFINSLNIQLLHSTNYCVSDLPKHVWFLNVGKSITTWPITSLLNQIVVIIYSKNFFKFLHSHCSHVTDMLITFRQNHISQALLKCMHVHCPSILTKFSKFFCIRRVM